MRAVRRARADLASLMTAVLQLKADCGSLPTRTQGLQSLLADPGIPGWKGPYAKSAMRTDPWGKEYRYVFTNATSKARIVSAGPDTRFETEDDIRTF